MDIHIFTTDISCFGLENALPEGDCIKEIFVPENRLGSEKVTAVYRESPYPVHVHKRGDKIIDSSYATADILISWMYSQIIDIVTLAQYRIGGLNMHGGRIPEYRGANVLNWAIANDEPALGVTWHEMVDQVDAGGIFGESLMPVDDKDTAHTMRQRIVEEGLALFPQAYRRFRSGDSALRYPDLTQGKVWPPRRPEDGRIYPGWDVSRVTAMIRAQTGPWPDAMLEVNGNWMPLSAVQTEPTKETVPYISKSGQVIHLEISKEDSQ